jgi:hypothetical protein
VGIQNVACRGSPDGADRLEAALARRLDRIARDMERIERHATISNEALSVFVRFWLTSTPPLPFCSNVANYGSGAGKLDTGATAANAILIVNEGTGLGDDVFYVNGNGSHGASQAIIIGQYDLATAHFAATLLA